MNNIFKLRGHRTLNLYAIFSVILTLSAGPTSVYASTPIFDLANCINENALTAEGAEYILNSLDNVYHGGNRTAKSTHNPRCISPEQKYRAEKRLKLLKSNTDERSLLNIRHPDKALKLMSLRNSDNDEYLDFRIKEQGAFIQNDPDADNDGIPNLLDPRPQTPGPERDKVKNNDANHNGLPDHLDWQNNAIYNFTSEEKKAIAKTQERLFQDYGVALIQAKGSDFRPAIVNMTEDVFQVFSRLMKKYKVQKGNLLKSITYAESYDYVPKNGEPEGVLAEVSPVNGQIIIYNEGVVEMDNDPKKLIAPFIVYIHEFAHVIQNAMDYPLNQPDLLTSNTHKVPRKFTSAVNELGWDIDINDTLELNSSTIFVDHGTEKIPVKTIYKNQEFDMQAKKDACDWQDLARDDDIVGCYSFYGIREWHAEVIANTVLRVMFERLEKTHASIAASLIRKAQCEMDEDWQGAFYDYKNADSKAFKKIKREMRIQGILSKSNKLVDRLNKKYIIDPFENAEAASEDLNCSKSYDLDS